MREPVSKVMKRYNYLLGELNAVYHEMSLKLGLSDSAMIILYTICDQGERCPLQDICRYSGLSKQTVNSALRKLEAERVLYLEAAGSRNKTVCLTEKGMGLAERTVKRIMQAENEIYTSWPEQDVEKYLELTEHFLTALQEKAGQMKAGMEHEHPLIGSLYVRPPSALHLSVRHHAGVHLDLRGGGRIFVSNFAGKTPFAAVNFIMPLLMILGCAGFMFGTGGGALIAKTLGEGSGKKLMSCFP